MKKPGKPRSDPKRTRMFRETARHIIHMDRVKGRYGEARDTAGAVARAMEQAYRLGFEEALAGPAGLEPDVVEADALGNGHGAVDDSDAMEWGRIPPRTRGTFWSICLAALGRSGLTVTPSYLEPVVKPRGSLAWRLVVPDHQPYDKVVGDGTIITLIRLGLMEPHGEDDEQVALTDYGIRTWNRFCERGGQYPDDLVDVLE